MKVLQILPELQAGGVERGTLELAAHLVQHGHESLVVSHGGRMVAELERAGSRHCTMPVHRKHPLSLLQIRPLRRLLEQERPDILHLRSRLPAWLAWFAWRGLPVATRPRLVTTVHGFNSVNFYSAIMTRGERVIAVSGSIRDFLLRSYPRTPPEVIRVIPRGIDPQTYPHGFQPDAAWMESWRRQFPQLAGRRVLTLPGRLTRLKGHGDFLELLQALLAAGENVHGLIVGGVHEQKAGYFAELQQAVAAANLAERVTFTGHRPDLREVLAVSDVVCSLSAQPEAFGRTTLEALALGRPVVGYAHGGVGELLKQLFPVGAVAPGDFHALLGTMRRMLSSAPAPARVGEPFTVSAMCVATLDVHLELSVNDGRPAA